MEISIFPSFSFKIRLPAKTYLSGIESVLPEKAMTSCAGGSATNQCIRVILRTDQDNKLSHIVDKQNDA